MITERRVPLRVGSKKAYVWDVDGAVLPCYAHGLHVLINYNEGQTLQ